MAGTKATDVKPGETWTVVAEQEGTQIVFDQTGDVFVGTYLGQETISPEDHEPFDRLNFEGTDGEPYVTYPGYKLTDVFKNIPVGTVARITYMKDLDMGPGKSPMKDFRVETKG